MTAPTEPSLQSAEVCERAEDFATSAVQSATLRSSPLPATRLEWSLLLVVVAGRCVFSLQHSLFRLYPDEPGTLAMARWLSGTGDWDMGTSLTWKPGMATLVAPFFWLTDDQETILRLSLMLAAVAGGLAAVLMSRLGVRLAGLGAKSTCVIAGLLALSPAALTASAYVWGEALVSLTFLATLIAFLRFSDDPAGRGAAVSTVWAAVGYLAHSRMLPLLITVGLVCAGRLAMVGQRRVAASAFALTVALVVAVDTYSSMFYAALWADPNDNNTVREVAGRLGRPLGIIFSMSGQLWYLLVSTAGVFGIGVCVLARRAIRGDHRVTRDARNLIVATLPLMGLSVVFMSDRERVDQQIYGRYNDAVVWPVIAVGVAWLLGVIGPATWRLGKPRRILFGSIALAVIYTMTVTKLVLAHPSVSDVVVPHMIPGVAGLLPNPDSVNIIAISTAALVAVGAIALASKAIERDRRAVYVVLAIVAASMTALSVRTYRVLQIDDDFASESRSVRDLLGSVIPAGDEVVFGFVPEQLDPGIALGLQGFYSQFYQWYLPEVDFTLIANGKYPDMGLAFAPTSDRVLVDRDACIVWQDPVVAMALWDTRPRRCVEPDERLPAGLG